MHTIIAYLALLIPKGVLCSFAWVKNLFGLNEAHNSDSNIECEYMLSVVPCVLVFVALATYRCLPGAKVCKTHKFIGLHAAIISC